jgi:hypothetical protein
VRILRTPPHGKVKKAHKRTQTGWLSYTRVSAHASCPNSLKTQYQDSTEESITSDGRGNDLVEEERDDSESPL